MCPKLVPGLLSSKSQGACSNTYNRLLETNLTATLQPQKSKQYKDTTLLLSRNHGVFNFSSIAQPCINLQNSTITHPTPCAPVPQHLASNITH